MIFFSLISPPLAMSKRVTFNTGKAPDSCHKCGNALTHTKSGVFCSVCFNEKKMLKGILNKKHCPTCMGEIAYSKSFGWVCHCWGKNCSKCNNPLKVTEKGSFCWVCHCWGKNCSKCNKPLKVTEKGSFCCNS